MINVVGNIFTHYAIAEMRKAYGNISATIINKCYGIGTILSTLCQQNYIHIVPIFCLGLFVYQPTVALCKHWACSFREPNNPNIHIPLVYIKLL